MDPASHSRRRLLAAGVAGIAGLAGCALPGPSERERSTATVDAPPDTPLVVDNTNGDVTVTDGGTDTVDVEITKRTNFGRDLFEEVTVETGVTDGRVRIETVTGDVPVGASVSVSLSIVLPDGVPVDTVRTENGDVRVEDATGDATLRTTNGRVAADGVDGFLTLRSSNGSVETRNVGGVDSARTTNGSIDVEVPAIRGDTAIESSNGEVRVAVDPEMDAEIALETTNGDVSYSGLDLVVDIDRETRLTGTLGDGGDRLSATTTNGDVRLRPL